MSQEYILCDLDHTVANAFHRDWMIGTVTWDEYHEAAVHDQPLWDIAEIVRLLSDQYKIIALTARPIKWRAATIEWLSKHEIQIHDLLMRPDDNYDPAPDLKVYLAQCYFEGAVKEHVKFILDDRDDVISAFKALGVTGLVVHGRRE